MWTPCPAGIVTSPGVPRGMPSVPARIKLLPPLWPAGLPGGQEKPHRLDDKHTHNAKEDDPAKHGMKKEMIEYGADVGCTAHLGQKEQSPECAAERTNKMVFMVGMPD